MLFKGSGVAIVTPFTNDGIDYEKLSELIERREVIKFTIEKVNKRVPVIVGTGSNNTAYSIDLSKYAEEQGADGLLLVTPYYNKTTQKGLIEHYRAIADNVNIPIILYNVPGRTGLNLLPKTVAELSKHRNIRAVKEASGDISQVAEIARLCDDDFYIYSGNDDMVVPLLSLGGSGVISVVANILPKDTHNMVISYLEGDIEKARKIQLDMKELIDTLFIETNPIPVKTAMNLMGMNAGELRLPLTSMTESNLDILKKAMKAYGIL